MLNLISQCELLQQSTRKFNIYFIVILVYIGIMPVYIEIFFCLVAREVILSSFAGG